jgi:site-specific DNA-methyltransferase (adenine-specific)
MVALIKFDAARRALAEAHRIDEIKAIRDKAEALRLYFKQQGESLVMQNQAAEIKLRAERKAGTLLAEMEKSKGMQFGGRNADGSVRRLHDETADAPTLADIGITKIQSYRFQRVARIPEHLFEEFIEHTLSVGGELTTKGLLERHPEVHHRSPSPSPSGAEQLPHYLELKQGDTLTVLKTLPAESVDMVLTSPPYYGLRDYAIAGQIGLEPTLEEYLAKMLAITAELKRVLKKTGTMWWNHGDSYGNNGGMGHGRSNRPNQNERYEIEKPNIGYEKSLLLQAHRLAIRMIDEQGWILRNQLIWHKPNVLPSSTVDRFTVDYEPIFLFSKSKQYYFEPQYEPSLDPQDDIRRLLKNKEYTKNRQGGNNSFSSNRNIQHTESRMMLGRNKRCIWTIPTQPFADAHFAVYPPELCEIPIKAGCPEYICTKCGKAREKIFDIKYDWQSYGKTLGEKQKTGQFATMPGHATKRVTEIGYTDCGCNAPFQSGIVLDPFFGTGTTAIVAHRLNRSWVGIELSEEYIRIAKRRLVEHGIQPLSASTAGVRAPLL